MTKTKKRTVEITDERLESLGACYARRRGMKNILPVTLTPENVGEKIEAFLLSQRRHKKAWSDRRSDLLWLFGWGNTKSIRFRNALKDLYREVGGFVGGDWYDGGVPLNRWPREQIAEYAAAVRKWVEKRPVTVLRGLEQEMRRRQRERERS